MRVGIAAVAMVLVAEAAVWLLRPRDRPIQPAPVSESDYFTPAQIDRGRTYSDGQLWLFVGVLGAQGAVLVTLALGRPAAVRRRLERLGARPVLGAAAAGAGLSVALGVATLPASIAAHERAVDFGISTAVARLLAGGYRQVDRDRRGAGRRGRRAADRAGAPFPAALVDPRGVAVAAIAAVFVWLAPVVLAPLFNKFKPLPATSRARAEVLSSAARRGRHRRGLPGRREPPRAIAERLRRRDRLDQAGRPLRQPAAPGEPPGAAQLVAHELGHVKHDDIPRGLAFVAIVAPLGLLFARRARRARSSGAPASTAGPGGPPAYALGLASPRSRSASPATSSRARSRRAPTLSRSADPRPPGADPAPAPARARERRRPGPAGHRHRAARHPPVDGGRIGAALAYEREAGTGGSSD